MPSSKVLSKPAALKTKVKRKRVEEPSNDVSAEQTLEKPPKKSRRDAVVKNPPAEQELPDSAKSTKKVKGKKSMEAVMPLPKEAKQAKPGKTKAVAFAETAQKDSQGKRKNSPLNRKLPAPAADKEDKSDGSVAPEPQEEDEIHLEGFSSESDSSDEDMDVGDAPSIDISKLPAFSKDDAVVRRKLDKAKKNPTEDRGVIYLGRIPHGFYEDQMRTYFGQFGDVTRLRLSRNKKTGQSKHYAFIEFGSSAVAEIVSETMDNYLLLGHILKCKVIPKDQVHPELWVGANKKWRMVPRDRVARLKQNKPRTDEEQRRAESKLLARQKKKQTKISALGIDYDFKEVAYQKSAQEPVAVVSATQ